MATKWRRPPASRFLPNGLLLAAAAALIGLVLFAKLPAWPKILGVLNNAAHAPVFGVLAVIMLAPLRRGLKDWAYLAAFCGTVLLGVAIEWIQAGIGRDASWNDVWTDALGAAVGLALAALWATRGTAGSHLRASAAVAIALAGSALILYPLAEAGLAYVRRATLFPVLSSFERPLLDGFFLETRAATIQFAPLPERWRKPGERNALRIIGAAGDWPGVAHTEPVRNWQGFSTLGLDLTNPGSAPLNITVRVHDRQHDQRHEDRFNQALDLLPESRIVLRIPLADIERGPLHRLMDMTLLSGIIVFISGDSSTDTQEFYVSKIWLE